jgi:hypothetical protein
MGPPNLTRSANGAVLGEITDGTETTTEQPIPEETPTEEIATEEITPWQEPLPPAPEPLPLPEPIYAKTAPAAPLPIIPPLYTFPAPQPLPAPASVAEPIAAPKPKKKYKPRAPKQAIDYAFIKSYDAELGTLPDKKAQKVRAWHKKLPHEAKTLMSNWFSTSKPMIAAEVFVNTGFKVREYSSYLAHLPEQTVRDNVRVWNDALDKGVKHPTTTPLFRGMHSLNDAFYKMYTDIGGEFTWDATQATSRSSKASAEGFTGGGDILFKILKPKGAIEVAPIGLGGEYEVFTRAKSKFKVKSVEKNVIHSGVRMKTFVTLEQIE